MEGTYILAAKVAGHLPGGNGRVRAADELERGDTAWQLERFGADDPILLISCASLASPQARHCAKLTHMVLDYSEHVLTTFRERRECERIRVIPARRVPLPSADKRASEPDRVPERGAAPHVQLHRGLSARRGKVCAPEDVAGVVAVFPRKEDDRRGVAVGVVRRGVIGDGPGGVRVGWRDLGQRVRGFLYNCGISTRGIINQSTRTHPGDTLQIW